MLTEAHGTMERLLKCDAVNCFCSKASPCQQAAGDTPAMTQTTHTVSGEKESSQKWFPPPLLEKVLV